VQWFETCSPKEKALPALISGAVYLIVLSCFIFILAC
jgi:hypothetical protein